MKKLFIFFLLGASLSAQAQPTNSKADHLSANLTDAISIDQNSTLHHSNILKGNININKVEGTITLELSFPSMCPAGASCFEDLNVHQTILPLITQSVDECNNTTFFAKENSNSINGSFHSLTVVDYTFNICPTLIALPATMITHQKYFFNLEGREMLSIYNTFEAQELNLEGRQVINH